MFELRRRVERLTLQSIILTMPLWHAGCDPPVEVRAVLSALSVSVLCVRALILFIPCACARYNRIVCAVLVQ